MDLRLRASKASLRQPCRLGAALAQVSQQGARVHAEVRGGFRARPAFFAHQASRFATGQRQGLQKISQNQSLKIAMNPWAAVQGYWSRFSLAADTPRFVDARRRRRPRDGKGGLSRMESGMRKGDVSIQMDKTWE